MGHNWKHVPTNNPEFWKCADCGKLDHNALPDTAENCAGKCAHCGLDYGLHICGICGKVTCENCMWQHTHEKTNKQSEAMTMSEDQASYITEKDSQAVKRLQEYFRRRAGDLKYRDVTDETFLHWLSRVLEYIRAAEYHRVKQIIENDPAFKK